MTRGFRLRNGVVLPSVGLGTYKATGDSLVHAVHYAIENGIEHIDSALGYKNGRSVYEGVRRAGKSLDQVFITSKLGPRNQGTAAATEGCREALNEFQTETLGMMLVHWPGASQFSPTHEALPQIRKETWQVMEQYYNEGRFRAIGVSNYEICHLKELMGYATVMPMVNQIEVHPRFPNHEVRQFCKEQGIQVVAYSSFGTGDLIHHPVIQSIAHRLAKSPAQVLLKWGLQQEMAVIPKSLHTERIAEWTSDATEGWELSEADMKLMAELDDGYKYCWNPAKTRGRERSRSDSKAGWREDEEADPPANIMFDRRVVRGNTYAPKTLLPERLSQFKASFQKRPLKKVSSVEQRVIQDRTAVATPAPVEGRCHAELQTEPLYEELSDAFPVADGATQTDAFLDRPPTPLYIPRKTGVDVATQILPGELFDFDYEVQPLVQYLVGKTLEQSLFEVHDELGRAALEQRREHVEEQRALALAAVQRMEAAEKRLIEEKERRLAEEKERLDREAERRQRVAAQTFARECLSGIVNDVFAKLDAEGHFRDPVEEDIKTSFLPWLDARALSHIQNRQAARSALLGIIAAAVEQRKSEFDEQRARHLVAVESNRKAAAEAERVKAEEARVFHETLQEKAPLLLQQTDPVFVDPELVEQTRAAIQSRTESEDATVSDAEVIEELIREGTVSKERVIEALESLD